MAEVLENYAFPKRRGRSKYPWDEWLDGRIHKLHRGTDEEVRQGKADFTVPSGQLRKSAQTYVSDHKALYARLEWDDADINTLVVRAIRVTEGAVSAGSGYEIRYSDGGILTRDFRKSKTDALEIAAKVSADHDDKEIEVWRVYQGNLTRMTAAFVNGDLV